MHGVAEQQKSDDVVVEAWNHVVNTVNKILDVDKRFGFSKFEQSIKPSIEEIVHSLGIIEAALNAFLDSGLLEHDETRQALNSKQCVLHIQRLAVALREKNENEYKEAITLLSAQAQV